MTNILIEAGLWIIFLIILFLGWMNYKKNYSWLMGKYFVSWGTFFILRIIINIILSSLAFIIVYDVFFLIVTLNFHDIVIILNWIKNNIGFLFKKKTKDYDTCNSSTLNTREIILRKKWEIAMEFKKKLKKNLKATIFAWISLILTIINVLMYI